MTTCITNSLNYLMETSDCFIMKTPNYLDRCCMGQPRLELIGNGDLASFQYTIAIGLSVVIV